MSSGLLSRSPTLRALRPLLGRAWVRFLLIATIAGRPGLGALVLLSIWLSFAVNFHQKWSWRSGGPAWRTSLDGAVGDCRREPGRRWAVAPVWPQGMAVEVSCRTFETHVR